MPNTNPSLLTKEQLAIMHGICDAYEQDRQTTADVALNTYVERAPQELRNRVLEELLSIEMDLLQQSGQVPQKETLFSRAGVTAPEFNEVWTRIEAQRQQDTLPIEAETFSADGSLITQAPIDASSSATLEVGQGPVTGHQSIAHSIGFSGDHVGALIADDYELKNEIGRGGMGVVFHAYQHSLRRHVALKIIPGRLLHSSQVVARFYVEAEAAAAMNHADIVRVFEVGESGGVHFYAMELVEGFSLSRYVGTDEKPAKERIDQREAVKIIERIARAVQYAHDLSVIHRDIKPENILVDKQRHPHLTDFGLAKFLHEEDALTATGEVLGTPAYMAPEQASGQSRDVSERTDVYGLGATLFGLLSGRRPYLGTGYEVMRQVVDDPAPSLRAMAPEMPLDLHTICSKCLEKRPQDRYASAADLADDLRRYLDGYPIMARPASMVRRLASWYRRNPVRAALIGAVSLTLLLGTIVSTYFAIAASVSEAKAHTRFEQLAKLLANSVEIITKKSVILPEDEELLNNLEVDYAELIEEYADDNTLRHEYADALLVLGQIRMKLSNSSEEDGDAREVLETARDALQDILAANGNDVAALSTLGSIYQEFGKLANKKSAQQQDSVAAALDAWRTQAKEATEVRRRVVEMEKHNPVAHRLLASSEESFALATLESAIASGDISGIEQGLEILTKVQQHRERALVEFTGDKPLLLDLAKGHGNLAARYSDLARLYEQRNDADGANSAYERATLAAQAAIAKFQEAGVDSISDSEDQFNFAYCYRILGDALQQRKKHEEAIQNYGRAIERMTLVISRNPFEHDFRMKLAGTQLNLSCSYLGLRDGASAEDAFDRCLSTLIDSLLTDPDNKKAAAAVIELTSSLALNMDDPADRLMVFEIAISRLKALMEVSQEYAQLLSDFVGELQHEVEALKSSQRDKAA